MTVAAIWAALKPWLKSFNVWLVLGIVAMGAVIWVGRGILEERRAETARAEGIAWAAKGAVTAATATANAERKAEAETPLPADRKAINDLCRKSASCRERAQK